MAQEHLSSEYLETQLVATRLAQEAGTILRKRFGQTDRLKYTSKGGVDFTTDSDIEVDRVITAGLREYDSTIPILTEETAPVDYSQLKGAEKIWIVDPLDGTDNFSRDIPFFGVSIALVHKGTPIIAVIYLPMRNELYTATAYGPALCNGREIHPSKTDELRNTRIDSGISWDLAKRDEFLGRWAKRFGPKIRGFTMLGSAVEAMAYVAAGRIDAYPYWGIKPWDQAAAGLLIQQAGGTITTIDGKPWNAFEPDILASNGIIHSQLLNLLAS